MNTDDKFIMFLKERFDHGILEKSMRGRFTPFSVSNIGRTFLMLIYEVNSSHYVSTLLDQFLATLSAECASEYVNIINVRNDLILFRRHINLMKVAIKYGANIHIKDQWGNGALMCAFSRMPEHIRVNKIKLLLDMGINVNTTNVTGHTFLMYCCDKIHRESYENIIEAVELLILNGATTDGKSNENKTALDHVRNKRLAKIMSQLLQKYEAQKIE